MTVQKQLTSIYNHLAINKYMTSDTLYFPDILQENPFHSNEEYVSYDVDSLFTSIPGLKLYVLSRC